MRQRKDPTRKAAKNLDNVKIEATASDGAENASDHFVTSFLAMGIKRRSFLSKLRTDCQKSLVKTPGMHEGAAAPSYVIRSGGVYGARSSRQAASYVIFCP